MSDRVVLTLVEEYGRVCPRIDIVTADAIDAMRAMLAADVCHLVEEYTFAHVLRPLMAFKARVVREQRELDAYLRYRKKYGLEHPLHVRVHPIATMTADDLYMATALEFL